MPGKRLLCSIFTFLCISSSLVSMAQEGTGVAPQLGAALCELRYWESGNRAERDSLLLAKAAHLQEAGDDSTAYSTLCRIPNYGLGEKERSQLICLKLIYSYRASMADEFCGHLDEAYSLGILEKMEPDGKPRRRSESAAMILSVIPGAGLAYAGEWKDAGKYFLLNSSILALGAGAFVSGLYLSAFLGGGMLLYTTLPRSTDMAVNAASGFNTKALLDYYAPVYDFLLIFVDESDKTISLTKN